MHLFINGLKISFNFFKSYQTPRSANWRALNKAKVEVDFSNFLSIILQLFIVMLQITNKIYKRK